ncbi:unnamed protein product [Paramecium sonneborni]|uniref:RNA helicase n=1 Tax=Paramecium sonneborni TaxID=65129 RepID=A0A8S1PT66_9CILI|nr:unnamed protein product [Paramecium sonneborni]
MQKRQLIEDFAESKYFDNDDEKLTNEQVRKRELEKQRNEEEQDDELDPLDFYMQDIQKQYQQELAEPKKVKKFEVEQFENEDPILTQYEQIKQTKLILQKKQKQQNGESEDSMPSDIEVDEIEEAEKKKKNIEPLQAIDHSQIQYEEFETNFYQEHEEIANLNIGQVEKIKREYQIHVKGNEVPKPIISFGHLQLDQKLVNKIVAQKFEKPTAIQSQALPCVLSGRNVIGVAKTGSGKTIAYVWPMLVHVSAQRAVEKKEGPIGLIMVPTRELGQQVFLETKKYAQLFNISVCALLGGENKHHQWKELRAGVDIIVATPGRLIEMVKKKATNMQRCTYVVLDEADQMFSLGFEYQIRSIINQIRPDKQILLFTATMKKKIRQLCVDMLVDPIVITIGENENQVNEDIKQLPIIVEDDEAKLKWLLLNLKTYLNNGKVLIFANQMGQCEGLLAEIKSKLGLSALTLYGDKMQYERTLIINQFKQNVNLLIATDIASRGLDIKEIRTVINYYPPKDADTYIHRIGRTGRAGNCDGVAFSLVQKQDWKFAIMLIRSIELAGQIVPPELEDIASLDDHFKMDRMKKKMGFDYARGKDASKILHQALKRQSNTKAGLGFDELEPKKQKKITKQLQDNPENPVKVLPVVTLAEPFGHLQLDQKLVNKIVAQKFEKPTAIQSQALPCVLSGRNVIGVAKTGSGKTIAYVWPMLVHVSAQRAVEKKEGPIGLIMVPTRELGQQVFLETKKYAQLFNISVCALLGGENKHHQWKELRAGVDIIVATPGRLIEMVKKKATNMQRCTYVVLDEADQMFSLGFEYQIRSIINQIRPDKQILLFTATMKKKIRQLCVDMLVDPIVITIGENENQVNEDIKQLPIIVEDDEAKLKWLLLNLKTYLNNGKVLIFANQMGQCEGLLAEIKSKLGLSALTLYGDKMQYERTLIINQFKQNVNLLIATDIASRGLDIKEIRTVINYYPPKDADTYIHRIGRTGRAGNCDGVAFSLVQKQDWKFAIMLIRSIELAGQIVPPELEDIASLDDHFKMDRMKKKMGFDYARGKDASKILHQALKRQSNTKAGLGFDELEPKKQKKITKQLQDNPENPVKVLPVVTLAEPTKSIGQFKNKWQDFNPYENYDNYAATLAVPGHMERDQIIQHYQEQMRDQFRAGFKSGGVAQTTNKKPVVKFINDKNNTSQKKS